MMNNLLSAVRAHALLASNGKAVTRTGLIDSYDPNTYAVKVRLQPEDVLTGWLPLLSPWVGNQWGIFAPPTIGDMAEVHFFEADPNAGFVGLRFYNDVDRPLPAPSGEFWVVHKTGSLLKFHNDGSVEVVTNQDLNATVGRNANLTVNHNVTANVSGTANLTVGGTITSSAPNWNHSGPVNITGNVVINGTENVTGMITGQGGMGISGGTGGASATITGNVQINGTMATSGDVVAGGISLDHHTHTDPQGGTVGAPQ